MSSQIKFTRVSQSQTTSSFLSIISLQRSITRFLLTVNMSSAKLKTPQPKSLTRNSISSTTFCAERVLQRCQKEGVEQNWQFPTQPRVEMMGTNRNFFSDFPFQTPSRISYLVYLSKSKYL